MSNQSEDQPACVEPRPIRPAEDVLWHLREATREAEKLVRSGIIEVAVRNPSVADYMKHWEGRATAAESEIEGLRRVLRMIRREAFREDSNPASSCNRIADMVDQEIDK